MQTFLTGLNAIAADTHDAIVVGNSFGAWLAIVWALEHPRSVRRAVLVNGGPVTGIRPDLTLTPSDRVEARRMWESLVDSSRWNVPELVFDEIIRKGREGAIARMSIPSMQPYLMDRRLPEIRIPVDLIWGESDQMVPLDYARRLASELPNARLVTIPVCGHVPQLECADRFTSTLLGVLSAC
jgi:pimeloyl-ACP methyl ester carboxylesterase